MSASRIGSAIDDVSTLVVRKQRGFTQEGNVVHEKKAGLCTTALPSRRAGFPLRPRQPAAGKAYWERVAPRNVDCRNCHGARAEGRFGPDLRTRIDRRECSSGSPTVASCPPSRQPAQRPGRRRSGCIFCLAAEARGVPAMEFEVPPGAPPGQRPDQYGLRSMPHPPVSGTPRNLAGTT